MKGERELSAQAEKIAETMAQRQSGPIRTFSGVEELAASGASQAAVICSPHVSESGGKAVFTIGEPFDVKVGEGNSFVGSLFAPLVQTANGHIGQNR